MVSALVQNELDNEALMLVYEMKKLWVAIDDITITILLFAASNLRDKEIAVLSTCNYTGLVDSGLQILEMMGEEYGIQLSAEHYACVVDMLGRVGRLDEAHNFAKKLGVECNVLGI
uniref:Pentatricopeptide repeat-containing protein, chloroplastic n=1 Tax=Solanum tuberosum TaxID=4113 RepID=M1BM39_SOLTU